MRTSAIQCLLELDVGHIRRQRSRQPSVSKSAQRKLNGRAHQARAVGECSLGKTLLKMRVSLTPLIEPLDNRLNRATLVFAEGSNEVAILA
jgi:hypothetical protein